MNMSETLFQAILAMDAYNRSYEAGIKFGAMPGNESQTLGVQIGGATIVFDSRSLVDLNNQRKDIPTGFYAAAYSFEDGKTIISYRGTDDPFGLSSGGDIVNGWVVGAGDVTDNQAELAFEFYNATATKLNNGATIDPRLVDISLTGHSLGGGLAGY
jgi:hypothetical protein